MHCSSLMKCFTVRGNTQLTFVRALTFMNPVSNKNYYKTLELNRNCTDKEVREAYIRLSKEYHPDRNPNAVQGDKHFVEINEAYSVLSKPATRRRYDDYLSTFDTSNHHFTSSYEELTHQYNTYNKNRHQRARRQYDQNNEMPAPKLVFIVICIMMFVGLIEIQIVKRVVKQPDEIVDGIPIHHSNIVGPDSSRMNEQQVDEYHQAKRLIIQNTVRSMNAEKEARQREQERLRNMIENNSHRQKFEE